MKIQNWFSIALKPFPRLCLAQSASIITATWRLQILLLFGPHIWLLPRTRLPARQLFAKLTCTAVKLIPAILLLRTRTSPWFISESTIWGNDSKGSPNHLSLTISWPFKSLPHRSFHVSWQCIITTRKEIGKGLKTHTENEHLRHQLNFWTAQRREW